MYKQLYLQSKKTYNEYKLKFNSFDHSNNEKPLSIISSLNPYNINAKHCLENNVLEFNFETFLKDSIENNNNFFNKSIESYYEPNIKYLEIIKETNIIAFGSYGNIFELEYEGKNYIIKVQYLQDNDDRIRACREILINQYLSCMDCNKFFLRLYGFEFLKNTENSNDNLVMFFEKKKNMENIEHILNSIEKVKYQLDIFIINVVDYLHERNLVHYDLKLSNIVYEFTGTSYKFYLIDFGLVEISKDQISYSGTDGYTFPDEVIKYLNEIPEKNLNTLSDYFSAIIVILELDISKEFNINMELVEKSRYKELSENLQSLFANIKTIIYINNLEISRDQFKKNIKEIWTKLKNIVTNNLDLPDIVLSIERSTSRERERERERSTSRSRDIRKTNFRDDEYLNRYFHEKKCIDPPPIKPFSSYFRK